MLIIQTLRYSEDLPVFLVEWPKIMLMEDRNQRSPGAFIIHVEQKIVWCRLAIGWCRNSEVSRSTAIIKKLPWYDLTWPYCYRQLVFYLWRDSLNKRPCCFCGWWTFTVSLHRLFLNMYLLLPLWMWKSIQQLHGGHHVHNHHRKNVLVIYRVCSPGNLPAIGVFLFGNLVP